MEFYRFKDMDLVEQLIRIFGLTNIHTFGPIFSLISVVNLGFGFLKERLMYF